MAKTIFCRLIGIVGLLIGVASPNLPPALAQTGPDLVVRELADPPVTALPGESFVVTARVRNRGAVAVAESTTKFYLVSTSAPTRKNLKGLQSVPALPPETGVDSAVTLSLYSDTLPGDYRLQACADGANDLPEDSETNNCRLSLGTITVLETPDLAVTAITPPPATVAQGQTFAVTSTVINAGAAAAGATTAKFYLVAEVGGTRKDLKGTLAVIALAPGQTFSDEVNVTVRPETEPGRYRLQGCADSAKVVIEQHENNCLTGTGTVQVTPRSDLVVTSAIVLNAPTTVGPGGTVVIATVVENEGQGPAGPSTMKYSLVARVGGTTKNMKGTSSIPGVALGASVETQAPVTVFSDTVLGAYNVQACVDSGEVIPEGSESNNCAMSSGVVTVADVELPRPDLVVAVVGDPPASVLPGASLPVSATVTNQGEVGIPASQTRFYLVSGSIRKNLRGFQGVPELAPGASAGPPATVEVFTDTLPGTYALQACADAGGDLPEAVETNNCRTSTGLITVREVPDLVVTALTDPPAAAAQGEAFHVTSTVQNVGDVGALASSTKYYLVSTATGTRKDLAGTQGVPPLDAGQIFTEEAEVSVRPETVPGQYRLQGCADSGKVVAESHENNCLTAPGTIQVSGVAPSPDLVVTSVVVKDSPVTVTAGGAIVVRTIVANEGLGDAEATALRFWLVPTAGGPLKSLSGTKPVPAIPHGTVTEVLRKEVTVLEDTAPGTYTVQACVDLGNDCEVSSGTVTVQ